LAYLAHTEGYWQVWVMDPERGEVRALTGSPVDKLAVSWFPDGESLLVNTQDGDLVRVDVGSGREMPVPFPYEGMRDARLSPDGTRVAFSLTPSDSPDANALWVCGVDGRGARQLTRREHFQHSPAWDPSGNWIYYLSGLGPGQGHDLWRVSLDGSHDERLSFGGAYRLDVSAGKDGWLAYSGNDAGAYDVWLKPPGDLPVQLTDDPAVDSHPVFSSDGRSILFESTRGGTLNLWRVSRNGGAPEQLTRHGGAGARLPVPKAMRGEP
jgi:TolB protein